MSSQVIHHASGGVTLVGPDAVQMAAAFTLASALKLYGNHRIVVSRLVSPMRMLRIATTYTGKTYKRGAYLQAADDVQHWAETMRAALPHIQQQPGAPA